MWIYPEDMTVFAAHYEIRAHFPRMSLPAVLTDEVIDSLGVLPLTVLPVPSFARATQRVTPAAPSLIDGVWQRGWWVIALTPQEQAEEAKLIQADIVTLTQARLDNFARSRNYDGILSACSYVSSTVFKFAQEAQYCVDVRDQTWSSLYTILGEVLQGQRPMPNGFEDIVGELPVLEWPQ